MNPRPLVLLPLILLCSVSCSVFPRHIENRALKIPFDSLMAETSRYESELVILAGYIIETKVAADGTTRLLVLQSPLDYSEHPKSRDQSQGRFLVSHASYLDPEVYSKGRAVTVAGTVTGKETGEGCPSGCLLLQSQAIHLWTEELYYPPSWYDPFYDPFYYDYPFYRFRRPYYFPYHPWPRYYPYW